MARHRDANWTVSENCSHAEAQLCVLMDIRDELKNVRAELAGIRNWSNCWRVGKALSALDTMGREARRCERLRRKKNKT